MATQDIRRVSEADLLEGSLAYGNQIASVLDRDKSLSNTKVIDSLTSLYHVRIYSLIPSDEHLREIEKQLVDAYVSGGKPVVADNIQKIGTDSILFTRPVWRENTDGSMQFTHAIGIMMPVKAVVLSIPQP